MVRLFERLRRSERPGSTPPASEAEALLDELLVQDEIIDRFDASYLDDLPQLLDELHGVNDQNLSSHELRERLEQLWHACGRDARTVRIVELPEALRAVVREERYRPAENTFREKRKYKMDTVASWARAADVRARRAADKELVNELQRDYSLQQGGAQEVAFKELARPETGDPWTPLIARLVADGILDPSEPVLAIGPRWAGEILYFREELNLTAAIGLDLFSSDEDLVKVGDMHNMPFEDDTFGLVYQRNTFDKSYDIRAALHECVRVLRDGGVLVSDDCYAYTEGVSELARTNIKHNRQILRVLGEHAGEVLHDREEPARDDWIERVGQLAVRIRKAPRSA